MTWSTSINKTYLNFSGFYRYTGNSINSIRSNASDIRAIFQGTDYGNILNAALTNVSSDAIVTTSSNIGREESVGLNIFGNINFTSKFSIGGSLDMQYKMLSNGSNTTLSTSNSGMVIGGRFNVSLAMKNNWAMQGFGFIRGRDIDLQGSRGGMAFYNLGIRKEFNDKKASLGFGFENFLNFGGFKVRSSYTSPVFTQQTVNIRYNTGVRVTFSYRIGKMSFNPQPRRKGRGVNNDDIKGGDGNEGGGMPGGQPQGTPQNNAPGNRPGGTGGGQRH